MTERICSVEDCERGIIARGWCEMHYRRWKKHGDPTFERQKEKLICSIDGCEKPFLARGWCRNHYYRWYKHGDPMRVDAGGRNPLGFDHRLYPGPYRTLHAWINRNFPRVGRCEYCARTDRATEYACMGHHYTRNRADWLELCRRCHRRLDGTSDATRAKRSANAKALWVKRKERKRNAANDV